ncbi:MAG TPA: hypothetical protein PK397_11845 [Ignavibacteriaceae bacterium]|nr:hypothetical protein [Ignavibacteriaceae bacterium]
MKLKYATVFLFVILPALLLFPQSIDKKGVDKRIKNIEGDVQKITITTSDGTVEIEGEEAAYLFKKLKRKSIDKNIELHIEGVEDDSVSDGKNTLLIKKDGERIKIKMNPGKFFIDSSDSKSKKVIKVLKDDDTDGVSVTEITTENGEEVVKNFTGSEAEEYLKNLIDKQQLFELDLEIEKEGSNKKFIIKTEKKKTTE